MEDVRRFELVSKSSGLCIKTIKITPLLTVLSESIHSRTLFFNFVLKCFPSANTIQTTDTFLDEVNPTTLERPVQFHVIYESEEPVKLPLEQLTNYNGEVESIINLTSTVSIESLEILPSNKQYVIDLSLFTALKCIELHTSKDDHSDLALTTDCLEQCIERSIHLIIIHNQPTHLLDDSINKFNPSIIHCISSKVTPIPLSYSHLPITHSCPYKIYNDFKSNLPLLTKLYCPYTYTGEPNEFLQHINSLSKIYLIRETPKTKVYNSYNLPTSLTKLNIDTTVKNPFPMNYTELTNLKTLKLTDYASKYSLPTTLKVLTIKRLRGSYNNPTKPSNT
ncbi:Leucine-rich repeat containing protein [Entamoeba marina]